MKPTQFIVNKTNNLHLYTKDFNNKRLILFFSTQRNDTC